VACRWRFEIALADFPSHAPKRCIVFLFAHLTGIGPQGDRPRRAHANFGIRSDGSPSDCQAGASPMSAMRKTRLRSLRLCMCSLPHVRLIEAANLALERVGADALAVTMADRTIPRHFHYCTNFQCAHLCGSDQRSQSTLASVKRPNVPMTRKTIASPRQADLEALRGGEARRCGSLNAEKKSHPSAGPISAL
jgi:hypothetical protein